MQIRVLAVLLLLPGLAAGNEARGQADQCGVERHVPTGTLDEPDWNRLDKAYDLVAKEQYDEAMEQLLYVRNRARGDYLKAVVAQAIAQVDWATGKYDDALEEFELAVQLNALPDRTHFALMYQIAQLYYMQERYDEALQRLDLWLCKSPPAKITAAAYVLQGSIYAQTEDWKSVIKSMDKAISMDTNPRESWYQLKLAAQFQLSDWSAAAGTLRVMISNWPDRKDYWLQLSNAYFKLEEDDNALSVIALAYRKNLLDKQSDLLYLSSLYSYRDVPYKAAEVLQKGIEDGIVEPSEKNWTMIADAWYAAEELEKSLHAYEEAGKTAPDGETDLRRGYILVDMERWADAREALTRALDKGGITDRQAGEAYIMKGMAEFNLGNWDQASTNWGLASRYKTAKAAARQWMNALKDERARKSS